MREKEYYKSEDGSLEISQVQGIGPFDPKALINPLSSGILVNRLRKKGENNDEIFTMYRPKL